MSSDQIQFNDGAAYERYMGAWSQLAGQQFLDWLAPASNLDWLDVGCGNGAFTEMLMSRCAPLSLHGIDPSDAQLEFARKRPRLQSAVFQCGDAMALPYEDNCFDLAVMPLVIFFVPVPSLGVTEMLRVVRPGGVVSAYAWDLVGGGFPYHSMQMSMRELGLTVPMPPSPEASQLESLQSLWQDAGLVRVETRVITVQRTFVDFEEYWDTVRGAPSVGSRLTQTAPELISLLKERLRENLPLANDGSITCTGRANAVRGFKNAL